MRSLTFAILVAAALLGCPLAGADTIFSMTQSAGVGSRYVAGETVDVTVTMNLATDGSLNALGLEEQLPDGWTFNTLVSGQLPDLAPFSGEGGLLEFSWVFSIPQNFPFNFTFRLDVPEAQGGVATLSGRGIALISEQEFETALVDTFLLREGVGPYHSSDGDENQVIGFGEIMRIIQFYNSGGYRCGSESDEDGYVAGTVGGQGCDPHSADYKIADFTISLTELLRQIQTFNAGFYTFCPAQGTEDGFCPLAP